MAAPTKRTPEVEQSILQAIEDGCPLSDAATIGGISHQTLNEWRKEFPEFSEGVRRARAKAIASASKTITTSDDWRARAWFLERAAPEDYALPQIIEKVLIKHGLIAPPPDSHSQRSEEAAEPIS